MELVDGDLAIVWAVSSDCWACWAQAFMAMVIMETGSVCPLKRGERVETQRWGKSVSLHMAGRAASILGMGFSRKGLIFARIPGPLPIIPPSKGDPSGESWTAGIGG